MMCFQRTLDWWCCRVHSCESFLLLVEYASLCIRVCVCAHLCFQYDSSEVFMILVCQITMFHFVCPMSHDALVFCMDGTMAVCVAAKGFPVPDVHLPCKI